ncbi:MAG: hypothetical protein QOG67_2791 [Verrucomicrobiota bacterium]
MPHRDAPKISIHLQSSGGVASRLGCDPIWLVAAQSIDLKSVAVGNGCRPPPLPLD